MISILVVVAKMLDAQPCVESPETRQARLGRRASYTGYSSISLFLPRMLARK
jgi:hypothetical protein